VGFLKCVFKKAFGVLNRFLMQSCLQKKAVLQYFLKILDLEGEEGGEMLFHVTLY